MVVVKFITDFRGAEIGEEREVSDKVADEWIEKRFAVKATKQVTAPTHNKSRGRPKGSKNKNGMKVAAGA